MNYKNPFNNNIQNDFNYNSYFQKETDIFLVKLTMIKKIFLIYMILTMSKKIKIISKIKNLK